MLVELIEQLGMINLVLLIVAVSLLVVVILFMSYFRTILSITHFAYPNAKLRARGVRFIHQKYLEPLIECSNVHEVFSKVEKAGTEIPKEVKDDVDQFEVIIEKAMVDDIMDARHSVPEEIKPFVDAWLLRYDVRMLKRALKGSMSDLSQEQMSDILFPVMIVDDFLIDEIMNSRDLQELLNVIKSTPFGEVFTGRGTEEDIFLIDLNLDRYAFRKMKSTMLRAETEDQSAIKLFVGKYTDIMNLKILIRGIYSGIDGDRLKDAMLPAGRELPEWRLEKMREARDIEEALVELEGTSYAGLRKAGTDDELYEKEKYLDAMLLEITSNMMTQYVLSVGPIIRFLMGREFEVRNLKAVARGIAEGLKPGVIKEMMIIEGVT